MVRLRKGDIWKAVLLVAAIILVVAFSIYNVTRFTRPARRAPARPQTAPEGGGEAVSAQATAEMFAPQQTSAVELLAQARFAPDPFRPYVALKSRETTTPPVPPPKEKEPTRVRPLPALPGEEADRTTLEAVGIVTGTSTLAVLGDGKERYYVRTGDKVVGGWYVAAIHATSVTVSKGRTQVTLPLVAPPP